MEILLILSFIEMEEKLSSLLSLKSMMLQDSHFTIYDQKLKNMIQQ